MPVPTLLKGMDVSALRKQCEARLIRLDEKRRPWFDFSLLVVQELMTSRLQYMLEPQSDQKGFEHNDQICDAAGHSALRTVAAAIYSGTMPSSSDWLDMVVRGMPFDDEDAAWALQQASRAMLDMHNQSNASTTLPELHAEAVAIGTAAFLFVDDDEDGFRLDPYAAGEYFIDEDVRGRVDTIYRRTTLTVAQLVDEFGIDALSPTTRGLVERPEPDWDAPIACVHAIEPDRDGKNPMPSPELPWRSVYYEEAASQDRVLAIRGFKRFPAVVWRWGAKLPGCPYAFGFGHDALPHLIRLRKLIYRYGQVVAQKSDPATQGGTGLNQKEPKRLPGQHNTIFGQQPISNLLKVEMDEKALAEEIRETREQVREVIGATLVASLRRISHQITAREADLRTSQDLTEWLPGLLRLNVELMKPYTELMWFRAEETGRLPQWPESIAGHSIDPEFNSPLARKQGESEVQEAIETAAILGEIAKVQPETLQNFNWDKFVRRIAKRRGWPADCYVPVDQVAQMRAAIAQQEAARKAAEAAQQGADVAETAAKAIKAEGS